MLSLFPEILFLAPLGAFLIRIAAAFTLAYIAYRHAYAPDALSRTGAVIEAGAAVLLLLGVFTQAGALLGIGIVLAHVGLRSLRVLPMSTMLLLLALCLSALVTGAGAFAFDLPL